MPGWGWWRWRRSEDVAATLWTDTPSPVHWASVAAVTGSWPLLAAALDGKQPSQLGLHLVMDEGGKDCEVWSRTHQVDSRMCQC